MSFTDNTAIENTKLNAWLPVELSFHSGEAAKGMWECMGNDFLLHKDMLRAFLLNVEFEKEAYIVAYSIFLHLDTPWQSSSHF